MNIRGYPLRQIITCSYGNNAGSYSHTTGSFPLLNLCKSLVLLLWSGLYGAVQTVSVMYSQLYRTYVWTHHQILKSLNLDGDFVPSTSLKTREGTVLQRPSGDQRKAVLHGVGYSNYLWNISRLSMSGSIYISIIRSRTQGLKGVLHRFALSFV